MSAGRRFELVRELGAGAFGTVYLAELISTGDFRKRVAIKVLNEQWSASGDAGRRLRDEARLLGRLRHRHIVQVDDLVRLDGRWAVIMEHIPGADLERVLAACKTTGAPFPAPAALEIVAAVATALDAAFHFESEGDAPLHVIHRDIKPSNIRLTADGDIKVLDFGIARSTIEGREARTEQVRYGSLGYMSPDRLLGDPDTPGGDIYGLGCVLYEMIAGKPLGRSALMPDQQIAQVDDAAGVMAGILGEPGKPVIDLFREMLRYEDKERPKALTVAERARKLARSLPGEDHADFTRRIVPQVAAIVGDETRDAKGTLAEQRSGDESSTMVAAVADSVFDMTGSHHRQSSPTLVLPEDGALPSADAKAEPEFSTAPASRNHGLIVGLIIAAVVIAVGAGVLLRPTSAPVEPTPVAAEPVLTAPADATPAETTPVETAPTEAPVVEPQATTPTVAETAPSGNQPKNTRGTPKNTTTTAPAIAEPPTEEPAVVESRGRLRAVKFAVADASSVTATCGDVSGTGTTSALLRDAPAGTCTVVAVVGGATLNGSATVSRPTGINCAAADGALTCQ